MTCLLALLGLTTAGCYNRQLIVQETFTVNSPYAVMDSPRLAAMKAENPPPADADAWWFNRHDGRLGVGRPADGPAEIVAYEILMRDRQRSNPRRISARLRRDALSPPC